MAGGEPPENSFLFLGDYVDRGYFSLECFIYLLALKINHPKLVYLLRGNHECRHLTKHFTFKLECTYKYGEDVYDLCMKAFDALPLAAVVNKQFFCVHGGLSPAVRTPADVNSINRLQETPKSGMMCDLLWSDPTEDFGNEDHDQLFVDNRARGCSYRFTYAAACEFLARNNLLSIIRGHEAQDAGHRLYRQAELSEFPTLITLFSAPNYVDVYKNKGAIMKYDGKLMNIRQFNCAPHPFYLPKFMNVFDWSLPFVGEKIADLLMAVLDVPTLGHRLETISDAERQKLESEKKAKMDAIKTKVRAVGRLSKMFATVRNERETLAELMNAMGTKIVPAKFLTLGSEDLRRAIRSFDDARKCDKVNEMLPEEEEGDENDAASICSLVMSDSPQLSSKAAEKKFDENGIQPDAQVSQSEDQGKPRI